MNITRPIILALTFLLPVTASAASFVGGVSSNGGWFFGVGSGNSFSTCNGATICQVAQTFLYLINYVAVPLLFAIAFIVFLWGVFQAYILSKGDPTAVKNGHKLVLWGVIGFVVMISLWGLVNVVSNTFGLGGYGAPELPLTPYY